MDRHAPLSLLYGGNDTRHRYGDFRLRGTALVLLQTMERDSLLDADNLPDGSPSILHRRRLRVSGKRGDRIRGNNLEAETILVHVHCELYGSTRTKEHFLIG